MAVWAYVSLRSAINAIHPWGRSPAGERGRGQPLGAFAILHEKSPALSRGLFVMRLLSLGRTSWTALSIANHLRALTTFLVYRCTKRMNPSNEILPPNNFVGRGGVDHLPMLKEGVGKRFGRFYEFRPVSMNFESNDVKTQLQLVIHEMSKGKCWMLGAFL